MHEEDWDSTPYVAQQVPAVQYEPPKRDEQREYNNYQKRGPPQQRDQPRDYNNQHRHNNYQQRDQSHEFDHFPKREFRSRNNFNDRRHDNQNENNFTRSNQDRGRRENDSEATVLKVPTRFVGRIIGKGGSKINELQCESQAKIQVTKDTEGETTIVKIFGSSDVVTKATELINDLTVDSIRYVEPINTSQPPAEKKPEIIDWKKYFQECDQKEKAEWDKLPPLKKDFYNEHPDVTNMTAADVDNFRKESNNIVVDRTFKTADSKPIPKPCVTFEHAFHNYPEILDELYKVGFEKPSPIQSQAWPVLLAGEDLIGIAQTGTGKTLAFLLPAMIHIDGQSIPREEREGPTVLVMAPTRELALQIDKEVRKYQYKGITAVCLYGGGNRREQVKVVSNGVDIIIATPGRLNDLIAAGHVNVKTITYVVLDEADRMLDMGFEPQIRKVMYMVRPTRQTVMTSATWPMGVRRLSQSYMVDPIQVYVGTLDLAAVHTVTQTIQIVEDKEEEKLSTFLDFIHNLLPEEKAIVFCGKKSRADDLSSELSLMGIPCQTIHGDREQADREQALVDIADGTVQILIATDVASRGLDIEDISHVINYDFPRNIEEYVHRVGRTGRAGRSGQSISYFTRADWAQAKDLIPILEEAQQYVPDEIHAMAERYEAWKARKDAERGDGRGGRFSGGGGGGRFGGGRKW